VSEGAGNVLTVWSRLIAACLVSAGVRDVVVSPGSRSTPFLLALREREELRLTVAIDERAAAFVALGMGRSTGRAAAVLATSGTAPAHWLPAVIEASLSGQPLLLLSANRPLGLASAGAAQTIDQTKLFGHWVRLFTDLGDPSADDAALRGVVRNVGQAVAVAQGPEAGPVHVDLHADKPLEPVEATTSDERSLAERGQALARRGVSRISHAARGPDEEFARTLADALGRARRPLVVAGPRARATDAAAIHEACAALGLVLAAEASSQLRFGPRVGSTLDASELVYGCERFARAHAPDLVLQIGRLPTAPTLEGAWRDVPRFVLDAGGVHDPLGQAVAISLGAAGATLACTAERCGERVTDAAWLVALRGAEALAWAEVERSIASGRGEGPVVRAACAAAPGATLAIGNSLPIRTLDRFVPGGGAARHVLSQRGANGIDGLVSGAMGAAIAGTRPVLAIVGDVSFVHDLNALAAAAAVRTPLVVVVVDNGGGRIFETLAVARMDSLADALPLFTTPHGIDLAAATRAYGVTCLETIDAVTTARAVSAAIDSPRLTVIRAVVDPHDADVAFRGLLAALDARLDGAAA
jgi:2-succinyl-5-enolpyruvyl-6-hydroxy-3-cyclohexene-1-carboxylate synthase